MAESPSENALTILMVDDEPLTLRFLERVLARTEYRCVAIGDGNDVMPMIAAHDPFLIISDLFIGDVSGIDVLREIRAKYPEKIVIMVTGSPSVETAVAAMQMGALDYLRKPFEAKEIILRVERARQHYDLVAENIELRNKLDRRQTTIVGQSPKVQGVIDTINMVAATDASVLVSGESGTGKELVAREIHDRSARAGEPFVPVDCVALPDQLLTSELFGYEKGAFTGAAEQRLGLFEIAAGGTIFLDEITELGVDLQAKLLRVLQEKKFRRVGGRDLIDAQFRIVSATNRDPQQAVRDGVLRQDLYYRLNVIPIELPALRERGDDIAVLADHFLFEFSEEHHRPGKSISPGAVEALQAHSWPGNVRELRNLIQRLVIMTRTDVIEGGDVRAALAGEAVVEDDDSGVFELPFKEAKQRCVERFEREYIRQLLARHNGVIIRAAEEAEVDRKTLSRIIAELGIR